MSKEWVEEVFPGLFLLGHGSDTGGNQSLLVDRNDKHYIFVTEGFDYGSWVGLRMELSKEERDQALNWTEDTYDFTKWLDKLWDTKEKQHNIRGG